jgi:hypothetical protein
VVQNFSFLWSLALRPTQDGNGQQENIDYFQAGSQGSPGAPGAPNNGVVHLRNDSPSISKRFTLSVFRETLPDTWKVEINNPHEPLGVPAANDGKGARPCENVRERRNPRIVFSIAFFGQPPPELLVLRLKKSRKTFY